MRRVWVDNEELSRVRDLFRQELSGGKESALIPYDRVLPLLKKKEVTRLTWSRLFREDARKNGIKISVRTNHQSYLVKVVDPARWHQAIAGIRHHDVMPPLAQSDADVAHLIPQSDPCYQLPEWTDHLRLSLQEGENVLLSGPTGSGKSTLIRELCARIRKPFLRVNLTGESSTADILGQWRVQGKEMRFHYGPVQQAMKIGAWLVLDELDAALPQVLFALQALLEEGGKLVIPETGEWITPHSEFRLIATANTLGRGDDSGLYSGTNVLNEAFLDRFHSVFHVDYLPPEQEKMLLLSKAEGLHESIAEKMVRVANDLRKALKDGVIYSSFSTRKLIAWGRKSIQLSNPEMAARYTIINKLSAEEDRRVFAEILQRHGLYREFI